MIVKINVELSIDLSVLKTPEPQKGGSKMSVCIFCVLLLREPNSLLINCIN